MAKLKRNDLQSLARAHIKAALLLLDGGAYAGAYYFVGLAVECAIKACIARATEEFEFPEMKRVQDSWHHDLTKLLNTAGLSDELANRISKDELFEAHWLTVKDWKVDSRYEQKPEKEARTLYQAATDATHGIIPWIEGTGNAVRYHAYGC
jgi:HEPN domain-containing protein